MLRGFALVVGPTVVVVGFGRLCTVGLRGLVCAGPAAVSLGVVGPVPLWARSGVSDGVVPVSMVIGVQRSSW